MITDEGIAPAAHVVGAASLPRGIVATARDESRGERTSEMRLSEGEKAHGPYKHRNRWRLLIRGTGGSQRAVAFDTREAAEQALAETQRDHDPRTVDQAVSAFLIHLRERGVKPSSEKTHWFRLRAFFQLGTIETNSGGPLRGLTPERCQALYGEMCRSSAVDTHRNCLTLAKRFGQWCAKNGWLHSNPLADIEPMGRRRRGKEQLRVSEARRFMATCLKQAQQADTGAIAAMTALLLGMRASEVVERVVRDLDDEGRLLWIPVAKTEAGRRTLEVPALLRPFLLKLAEGKRPADRLFTEKDRHWLHYHVERLCRLAEVPVVRPHSLRGLHSTLATEHGATGHVVAAALGHTSYATTVKHYVQPGTLERATRRKVEALVAPTPQPRRRVARPARPPQTSAGQEMQEGT